MQFEDLQFKPHGAGMGGIHAEVEFSNGYGASIIQTPFSYGGDSGLYELAVIKGQHICYDTPLTGDVLGNLTEEEVTSYLQQIEKLPADAPEKN